jgi:hypothetical protein
MITYLNLFFSGLRWGAIEQFTAQLALLVHQFFLFKVCGASSYGHISVLFSFVWLVGALMNFGFDQTLSPFFADSLRNRFVFRKIVLQPLIIQTAILALGATTSFCIIPFITSTSIDQTLWLLLSACSAGEGFRRSLRIILQFSGRYKSVASIEIMYSFIYIGLVWSMHWIGIPFAPIMLLSTLLFVNTLSIILLAGIFREFYYSLPATDGTYIPPYKLMLQTRFFGYTNQIINQLLSTSFLVPLTAALLGKESSAVAALTGYLSYFIGSLFKRTFGVASGASFAQARREVNGTKRALFAQATSLLLGALTVLIVALPFMLSLFLYCIDCPSTIHYTPLYLLFFITLSEHLLMTYERFFLTEDQIHLFTFYNFFGFLLVGGATFLWNQSPGIMTTVTILVARIFSIALIARIGFKKWGITATKQVDEEILASE